MVGEGRERRERREGGEGSVYCLKHVPRGISWIKVEIGRSVCSNLQVWRGAVHMVQPRVMMEQH